MPRACDLKRGSFVKIKNMPYILEGLQVSNPSARGAATLYHFRFRNVIDKSKEDITCKGEELFPEADFERRSVQYLYGNQGLHTFMDQETFDQFDLTEEAIGDKLLYLLPDMENIQALFSDGQVMTIEPPGKVTLKIAQCSPVMKGAPRRNGQRVTANALPMRTITYTQILRETLAAELERDPDIFLMGEDIGVYGGSFGVTRGLLEQFGPRRVRDTPITEASLAAIAAGAALAGSRPVLEIMFMDFITLCADTLINHAAKLRGIYNQPCPLIIRTPSGAGRGYGATHSQSLERLFFGIPGINIATPATAEDASGLLQSALRSSEPTLFIEHKLLYPMKFSVPEALPPPIPFGHARIARPGSHITLIAWSHMLHPALAAAGQLAAQGIQAEVIDLRTLAPLDIATPAASAMKTGRVLIIEEGSATGGCAGEIAYRITRQAGEYLEKPILRLAGPDAPIPANRTLEAAFLPSPERIAQAVLELFS